MLKRIQRKIKNKVKYSRRFSYCSHLNRYEIFSQISAQESRRKKKEYVDALEKKIEKCMNENNNLKELLVNMEKNQKYVDELSNKIYEFNSFSHSDHSLKNEIC